MLEKGLTVIERSKRENDEDKDNIMRLFPGLNSLQVRTHSIHRMNMCAWVFIMRMHFVVQLTMLG